MTENQPIGFFDSGWGGLSIMKTARETLPFENFLYVADCGHSPYGDQSHELIVERARKISAFLFEQKKIKALVVACNTATAEAIDVIRNERPDKIIIGVEPAVKPAVLLSKNKCIGMISTTRTAHSARYLSLLERFGQNARILSVGCPGLMDCVEAGEFDSPSTIALLHKYLDPLIDAGIDTLILGCTHYPFLTDAIRSIVGSEILIYEPSPAVAKHLKDRLGNQVADARSKGNETFYVSGLNEQRKSVANRLWGNATLFEELSV